MSEVKIPDNQLNPPAQQPVQPYGSERRVAVPSLMDLLLDMKRETMQAINSAKVGAIKEFNADNQTAQIEILQKQYIENAPDNVPQIVDYPLIIDVPVFFAGGGLGSLTFPVAAGDECLVLFNDRDIDLWFKNSQVGIPNSNRLHDISDGFALVGFRSEQNALVDFLLTGVKLRHGDANVYLQDGTEATLKSGTSQVKVNKDGTIRVESIITLLTAMDTLYATISALVAALQVAVQTDGSTFNPTAQAAFVAVLAQLAASLVTLGTVIS